VMLDALILSLVVGKLRGGLLASLAEVSLRGMEVVFAAFVLRVGPLYLATRGWKALVTAGPYLYILSFALLVWVCWLNRDRPSWWVIGAGVGLNLLVVALNGGAMPVSVEAVQAAGLSEWLPALDDPAYFTHVRLDSARLPFLADVLILPPPYPRPRVFSPGDLLIATGVFVFVQGGMFQKNVCCRE